MESAMNVTGATPIVLHAAMVERSKVRTLDSNLPVKTGLEWAAGIFIRHSRCANEGECRTQVLNMGKDTMAAPLSV
jgi:hypothetical protein